MFLSSPVPWLGSGCKLRVDEKPQRSEMRFWPPWSLRLLLVLKWQAYIISLEFLLVLKSLPVPFLVSPTDVLLDSPYSQFFHGSPLTKFCKVSPLRVCVCACVRAQLLNQMWFILQAPRLWRSTNKTQSCSQSSDVTDSEPASRPSGFCTKKRLSWLEKAVTPNNSLFSKHHTVERKNGWLQGKGELPREWKATWSPPRVRTQTNIAIYPTRLGPQEATTAVPETNTN